MKKITNLYENKVWTTRSISIQLFGSDAPAQIKKTERWMHKNSLYYKTLDESSLYDENKRAANEAVVNEIVRLSRKKRKSLLYTAIYPIEGNISVLFANDSRNKRRWVFLNSANLNNTNLLKAIKTLARFEKRDTIARDNINELINILSTLFS